MDIFEEATAWFDEADGEKRIIGKSVFGRAIYAVRAGKGEPAGIAQYAIHGREWITAKLAFFQSRREIARGSVWFVPLLNPDGALLSQKGLLSVPDESAQEYLSSLQKNGNFSLWKANGRGVDLNVNFAADWGKGKRNVRFPSSANYIGKTPFSEPETQALKSFTEEVNPAFAISYHTKGEEIYWYYHQSLYDCARDKYVALALSEATGYKIALAKGSVGGYKDWCVKRRKIPSLTVEVGSDDWTHPIGENRLAEIKKTHADDLNTIISAYVRHREIYGHTGKR